MANDLLESCFHFIKIPIRISFIICKYPTLDIKDFFYKRLYNQFFHQFTGSLAIDTSNDYDYVINVSKISAGLLLSCTSYTADHLYFNCSIRDEQVFCFLWENVFRISGASHEKTIRSFCSKFSNITYHENLSSVIFLGQSLLCLAYVRCLYKWK